VGRIPLFPNDAPSGYFLFQLPNPLLQELPLRFLLGQGQRLLIDARASGDKIVANH
jgi:hypothetical protein